MAGAWLHEKSTLGAYFCLPLNTDPMLTESHLNAAIRHTIDTTLGS
jgi:hypothetical protein